MQQVGVASLEEVDAELREWHCSPHVRPPQTVPRLFADAVELCQVEDFRLRVVGHLDVEVRVCRVVPEQDTEAVLYPVALAPSRPSSRAHRRSEASMPLKGIGVRPLQSLSRRQFRSTSGASWP